MKDFKHIYLSIILSLFSCFFSSTFAQYKVPDKPLDSKQHFVYDYTDLLSERDSLNLNIKLRKYSDTTSTQIVVAVIKSTKGENIGLLTPRWAQEWGIGQAKEDNGVFILLAKNDRKIWISPGYGVEDKLTAGIVGEITRNVIIPEFKSGSYYIGLDKGTDAIFNVLSGKYQRKRQSSSGEFPFGLLFVLFIFFVIFIIAISKHKGGEKGGGNNRRSGGDSLLEAIILSNMGRGSYRSDSSSSGGFGGFGGGSSSGGGFGGGFGGGGFSGGGAGGSW